MPHDAKVRCALHLSLAKLSKLSTSSKVTYSLRVYCVMISDGCCHKTAYHSIYSVVFGQVLWYVPVYTIRTETACLNCFTACNNYA